MPEVKEDILDVVNETPDLNPLDFYMWDHLKSLVETLLGQVFRQCQKFGTTFGWQ
jgi:hypothetical protein